MDGLILGVDPGAASGGWAVLDGQGKLVAAGDLPVAGSGRQRMVSAPLLVAVVERLKPSIAIVERVGPMPRQGVSSTFKFGRGLGIIEGVIGGAMIPVSYVPATVWKKYFHLGRDKEQARQKAIEIWPDAAILHFARKKDRGRAEAALIALWQARAVAVP
jgi:Holliday junction resolvasome RuvABC endonuclease subunit